MATVTNEQIVQRTGSAVVAIAAHGGDLAAAEVMWASTTSGNTVTTTDTIDSTQGKEQHDINLVLARLEQAADFDPDA